MTTNIILQEIIKIVIYGTVVILFISVNALFLIWMERKVSAVAYETIQLDDGGLPLVAGFCPVLGCRLFRFVGHVSRPGAS